MALVKGKGRQTTAIGFESEGADQYLRLMRDGSAINMPWLMAKVLEGKVFGVNSGTQTSPTTFNASLTAAKPDLLVGVPSGTTIIPVYISIGFEDTGTVLLHEACAIATNVLDVSGLTANSKTIMNLRTDKSTAGSQCSAYDVVSAGGTDPASGNFIEFWHPITGPTVDFVANSTAPVNYETTYVKWTIGDMVVAPAIVGSGSLNVYASAQAGIGFITAIWVEETTSNLTS